MKEKILYDKYTIDKNNTITMIDSNIKTSFESLENVETTFNRTDYPRHKPLGYLGKVLLVIVKENHELLVYWKAKQRFKYEVVLETEYLEKGTRKLEETGATVISAEEA